MHYALAFGTLTRTPAPLALAPSPPPPQSAPSPAPAAPPPKNQFDSLLARVLIARQVCANPSSHDTCLHMIDRVYDAVIERHGGGQEGSDGACSHEGSDGAV